MKTALLTLGVILMTPPLMAKRSAPAKLEAVKANGIEYSQNFSKTSDSYTVSLLAKKSSNGSILWTTKLFQRTYDQALETDVQEIFLRSLTLDHKKLKATDERGQIYEVDVASGKLLRPETSIVYPAFQDQ